MKKKARKEYPNITRDVDPMEKWQIVGELGDGVFGKVYKVRVWPERVAAVQLEWNDCII